ncbi:uncharacterized protein LOC120554188 isoform X4 [Perca fluviatilis]|uniref:uncharacterized protein LOC120554188 isoform X4 n=1 Tax=Perca fluviatilis TaxID=8168 RepID=UPI001963A572|nr:uncharacterized protein LOC120554188 isoform X4 [Perca fluviatilis]
MASTTRSASDYVKNHRARLVGKLKNLSVILENLNQENSDKKKVLSDEEVCEIEQAEKTDYNKTRRILDSVIKKGEAACYEFLRIIYMTRKRTLDPDLHYWISCFPFKEDTEMDTNYLQGSRPCHRYQGKLKSKAQQISKKFWKNQFKGNNKSDLSYMSLVLDTQGKDSPSKIKKLKNKKSKMSRKKKLRTYIPEVKADISPSDLLKKHENILLVGKPGIGKTALTHEMLKLWAERDNEMLDYMFYFDMRETSDIRKVTSLEDLLFSVFSEPDEDKEEVLQDIKQNSDNVTLIFDGVTDLSSSSVVKRLVEKDLLPDAKVIVTCRQDDEEKFPSEDFLKVEVKGFSEHTIKTYLSAMLGEEQKKVLSNVELLTLCHVPMYALMVAVCFSSETPEDSPQPCTITEIYINIVRFCLRKNSKNIKEIDLNDFINNNSKEMLSLAEAAFHATEGKTVNLTERPCKDSCVLCFLKALFIKVAHTETKATYAFLHYTMQEFFAALWLLKNPEKIKEVFQQCLTEEKKHMKHLIPFMCRLLNEKSPSLMNCLIPAQELKNTSNWFFKEMITTFSNSELEVDILFFCQCLYESQCPEACVHLLDKLGYHLDLSGESLDPYPCCAVAYVVTQSKERKISLDLEDVTVSEQGMTRLFGCLENVQWCDPLPQQLWRIFLLNERQMDPISLLGLDGNRLHLPVEGKRLLYERAVKVMQKITTKVNVCLHWERKTPVCHSLCESLFEALPYISSFSFRKTYRGPGSQNQEQSHGTLEREEKQLLLDLCLKAAIHEGESFHNVVNMLISLFSVSTDLHNILLDFYQHVKSEGFSAVIPKLRPLFQSAAAVWIINLSERKSSILLEVLKLQPEKKPVELRGCSDEESEVRSFLQCLPYISQLSVDFQRSDRSEEIRFFGNLFCAAAEREQQTGEKTLELLSSVCRYNTFPLKDWDDDEYRSDFLLDLYSHLKDCETKTGLSLLPSLQSVFQSAPAVWIINLSERKCSILLEVLKLQSEKKQVKLRGCSDEESEVRSFLQCLPYISQLSYDSGWSDRSKEIRFFGNLFCAAAEREQQTGEKTLELLSSVCRDQTFPFNDQEYYDDDDLKEYQSDFLLDLCSHLKDCETKTGLSLLPSLQSVFQSAAAVWIIDLSKRKSSILLEVLKLQSEKKQVKLRDCSDEESEVRSFLQCLPYISQLSYDSGWSYGSEEIRFFGNLFCAAAEREQQTGEKTLELLSSVCRDQTFPFNDQEYYDDDYLKEYLSDYLLDLCSHIKDYETKTGLSLLPSLQSVFQSAAAVWIINLSKRKSSILLEVLKLQSEKKQVKLRDCSDEESEVRSFLQCLPYISQLSYYPHWSDGSEEIRFFGNLFCAAAEREQQTGEKTLELLLSVCRDQTFPFNDQEYYDDDDSKEYQSDFLLDLCSHIKDYETKTGLSLLPSLQSVFQSAPAVWFINLSERKCSILLEVLKLQSEKKQVKLRDCSDEESEVRSFLQCLPYISQLSYYRHWSYRSKGIRLFVNLFCAAAEREQQTGEKTLELLSSVCRYNTFPLKDWDDDEYQSDFLLDLYSHLKDCETKTGLSLLTSLQSVFQSAPAVWTINLSERKSSILLEVLKLQSEKKRVKLRGCSDEESEVRSFLQCLPYISQLSCDPEFFQRVCSLISVRSREEAEQLSSVLQLLGFSLLLTGQLRSKTCRSVGTVVRLCGSDVDLILTPRKMSVRGASLLFRRTTQLHSLKLSTDMALLMCRWVRRGRVACRLTMEELSLSSQTAQPSERVLLKVVSSLASLLRYWTVRRLDLTEVCVPAQGLIPLLLHDGPLTIKLSEKVLQPLLSVLHEIQDEALTCSFFRKVGGELTSCCLNWELLHYLLLQSSAHTITVNMRKNRFLQERATRLLPFLDRIVFKRPCPSFVLTAIREIYKARASPVIPSLLRSLDDVINLTCREMDSEDFAALLFTLTHSDRVKLNLTWTSIPAGDIKSILLMLDKVSHLSVDRNQLLRLAHCCAASEAQQGAAAGLLRTLQHRLDLSCCSSVELDHQSDSLSLTAEDCRAVSTILTHSSRDTQLILQDCELEDSGLDLLFPVLHRVRLRASKAVLLRLVSLVPVDSERESVRRAVSLRTALDGQLDLSHSTLDQRACGALALMLDFSEELPELDLSHCGLTDQLLLTLSAHLHKVQVLDLSHNNITDASADLLLRLSINPSTDTVRLFGNNIVDRTSFKEDQRFEMW